MSDPRTGGRAAADLAAPRPRGALHPESSNSLRPAGGGDGGGSRRSTTGGAVRRTPGGEAGADSVLRSTSSRAGRAGPRRSCERTRAGGCRGAMRTLRAGDAAWRRARAAAALGARATCALARACATRLRAVGAACAEDGRRSGAGDANDGIGGAGAVSATLALSPAPGAGAARSTMNGTIIPTPAAATMAQMLHAFLRVIRSHTRDGSPCDDGEQQPPDHQRFEHPSNDTATVHRTRRLPAKNEARYRRSTAARAHKAPACWTTITSPRL
jgi:hypothetical protein